ncbi:hypothetical protein DH2020_041207 [Rehmannia glutinosa]|uniref:Protein BIG GRAIN 1-like B n=1 Tax=Rehmannia glutinosa TaxID=99300 RepID=A0ABR0UQT9_REHGL
MVDYGYTYRYSQGNHPSFSSTLLDAIYRSIDKGEEEVVIYSEAAMRKKQSYGSGGAGANVRGVFKSEEEMANFQRACMIEKWMEKKVSEKVVVRRKSVADDLQMKKPRKDRENNSSWSSSDSSCGGGGGGGGFFSSSEAESFPVQRPKPVRTGFEKEKIGGNHRDSEFNRRGRRGYGDELEPKPKHEGGFLKTKSRALKIYGDLKKVKQPISPGGKLAGFLNSIFTGAGNLKKPKTAANGGDDSPSLKSTNASTCSSASSFSRSCLSKTPSSRGKSSNGAKRSVRFSPVSVIVDEDRQQKPSHENNNKQTSKFEIANNNNITSIRNVINEELMVHVMEKNRRVEEVARDLLRNYQKKSQLACEFEFPFDHLRKSVKNHGFDHEDDEEEEDDAASYASSDLFELDNLSAIGMERYREELPVYETTHLDTNRRQMA